MSPEAITILIKNLTQRLFYLQNPILAESRIVILDTYYLSSYWDISNGYYDCYLMSDITKGLDSDSDSEDEDEKDNEENNNNDE